MKQKLLKLNACDHAISWAGEKSWKEIYETCHRGDWLLWLFYKTMDHKSETDFKLLTLAKAKCANTVRELMEDKRSIDAIDACFAYVDGRISKEKLAASSAAAYAAAASSASAAAAAAAAASSAASSASAAASSASAASYASSASSAAATKNELLTADLVRESIPFEMWNI